MQKKPPVNTIFSNVFDNEFFNTNILKNIIY